MTWEAVMDMPDTVTRQNKSETSNISETEPTVKSYDCDLEKAEICNV